MEPDTLILDLGRMQHGSRKYSFRSACAGDILDAIKDQINIICSIIALRRDSDRDTKKEKGLKCEETNYHSIEQELPETKQTAPKISVRHQQTCSQEMLPILGYDYNPNDNTTNKMNHGHTSHFNPAMLHTDTYSNSINLTDKYETEQCVGGDYFSSTSTTTSSDIYPHFERSVDRTFLYETLDLDIRSRHDHRNSSPPGPCANVIYQDVDIDVSSPRHLDLLRRRRVRRFSKSTFVSYIPGGSAALRLLEERGTSAMSDESTMERQCVTNFESPGVYSKLFDPVLLQQMSQEPKEEDAYDTLTKDK